MNTLPAYDRAHDDAQRLARRHERDLHWAKERRRQQEREIAEAAALLAIPALTLARRTLVVSAVLLALTGFALDLAFNAGLTPAGPPPAQRCTRATRASRTRSTTSTRACTRSSTRTWRSSTPDPPTWPERST